MIETLQSLPIFFKYIVTAIIGMTPVIEIRGAIPIGVATFNLSYLEAFISSFIGNIIPTKKIEESEKLQNFVSLGLFLFVAIPIPTTGAWVGSLIANFLNLPVKKAFPPLALGVFVAGLIVLFVTGGVITIIN